MHLNRAADSTSRMVERQIKTIIREMAEKDSLMIRNGRKVIPVKKWIKMAKTQDVQFIRRYLPDRPLNMHVLPRTIATSIMDDKEWKRDYRDVLWEKEDPHLGHIICRNCVMSPESNADPVIATIFAKGLELEFYSSCTIVNCFECPSKKLSEDIKTLEYGDYAKILFKILHFAYDKSRNDNRRTIELDYANNIAYKHNNFFESSRKESIEQEYDELRYHWTSDVLILSLEDLYSSVFDRKSLERLFDQYESAINSGHLHAELEPIQKYKEKIIEFLMKIKNKVTVEDFRGLVGKLCDTDSDAQKIREFGSNTHGGPEKSGRCENCNGFASIRCVTCNLWHCHRHWKSHGEKIHGFEFPRVHTRPTEESFTGI